MSPNKKLALKILLLFFTFFIISFAVQRIFKITPTDIEFYVSSFGPIALVVYAVLLILGLTIPFNPLPDYAVVTTAAAIFRPYDAIFATFIAHSVSLCINYVVGKQFGWKLMDLVAKEQELDYVKNLAKRITPKEVFGLRFILPLTAIGIDVASLASGMAKMNFAKFFLASIIPWTILSIIFFTSTSYLKQFSQILFFLPTIVLIVVSYLIYLMVKKG